MNDRSIHTTISRKPIAWLSAVLVGAGLFLSLNQSPGMSKSYAQDCPGGEFPGSLEQILDNPEIFIGCKILIQGVLEKEEGEDLTSYAIRTASGHALDVWPWAPEESSQARERQRIQGVITPMSYYVGLRLRVVGKLVQERNGRVVLEASLIEEPGEHTEE